MRGLRKLEAGEVSPEFLVLTNNIESYSIVFHERHLQGQKHRRFPAGGNTTANRATFGTTIRR